MSVQKKKLKLREVMEIYPWSHSKEVAKPKFQTQACLTPGPNLLTILLCLWVLGIQKRRKLPMSRNFGKALWFSVYSCEEGIWSSFVFCRFSILSPYMWENATCRDNMLKLGERIESQTSPLPMVAS